MIYAAPGAAGAKHVYKSQYNNFIGGQWVAPVKGQYFDVITPVNGKVYTQAARSTAEDIELALDAAHAAADAWGKTDAATRSNTDIQFSALTSCTSACEASNAARSRCTCCAGVS